ncbi:MAG TPA: hypothetical protein VKE40_23175 [Gemmataceae bacterium]|nr:hypothetical protein [Gemmataceae bacterium]
MNAVSKSASVGSSRRSTPTRSRRPRLAVDRLEARDNPSGNISATQVGGLLILTGDDLDNRVQIRNVNTSERLTTVTVTGLDGTTIDKLGTKKFEKVQSLRVVLKGGNDLVTADPAAEGFAFSGPVAIDLGNGNNELNLDPAGRLFAGRLTVTAGDGDDSVFINGNPVSQQGDSVNHMSFNLGHGSSNVSLNSFHSLGQLRMTAGDGSDSLSLNNVELDIANATGKFAPLMAKTGNGALSVALSGTTKTGAVTLTARGDVLLNMNGASTGPVDAIAGPHATSEVDIHGTSAVNGNLTVRGNSANLDIGTGDVLKVTGNASVMGAAGASIANAGTVTIARGLTVQATTGDAMAIAAAGTEMTVGGNMLISGANHVQASFSSTGPSEVKGNATIRGGPSEDSVDIGDQFKVGKNLSISLAGGADHVHIFGPATAPGVGGNLSIATGAGADEIVLDRVSVNGKTSVSTGTGADHLAIESGSTFTGVTTIDLGSGNDALDIATSAGTAGPVTFTGKLTANLGDGNDTLALGMAGAGDNGNVVFKATGNKFDAGPGMDLFDPQVGQFDSAKVSLTSFTDPTP